MVFIGIGKKPGVGKSKWFYPAGILKPILFSAIGGMMIKTELHKILCLVNTGKSPPRKGDILKPEYLVTQIDLS